MKYAGFWRRFAARLIDGIILIIPGLILAQAIPFVGGVILALFYTPIFEASALKGTPGKALMGIVVCGMNGERITMKQAFIRYFASLLSSVLLCVGYLMNLFTAKRQTLHDLIAETVVVYGEPPEVNYFQVWLIEIKRLFGALDAAEVSAGNTGTTPSQKAPAAVETLEQLHRLFQSGALSEAEYNAKKEEILKKI